MNGSQGWVAKHSNASQWIQVAADSSKFWKCIIIQGRGNPQKSQYVKEFRLLHSADGDEWEYVENGKIFLGNTDSNTKVKHRFGNLHTKMLRIVPVSWNDHISLRFDAIYTEWFQIKHLNKYHIECNKRMIYCILSKSLVENYSHSKKREIYIHILLIMHQVMKHEVYAVKAGCQVPSSSCLDSSTCSKLDGMSRFQAWRAQHPNVR